VSPLSGHPGLAKYDLSLVLREEEGGLRGYLEYSTDLFTEATTADLVRYYAALLHAVVADPDADLDRLRAEADAALEGPRVEAGAQ
jgi:non-ribosomal peptide synthetase component F